MVRVRSWGTALCLSVLTKKQTLSVCVDVCVCVANGATLWPSAVWKISLGAAKATEAERHEGEKLRRRRKPNYHKGPDSTISPWLEEKRWELRENWVISCYQNIYGGVEWNGEACDPITGLRFKCWHSWEQEPHFIVSPSTRQCRSARLMLMLMLATRSSEGN